MTIQQIADRLADHCRKSQWEAGQRELYAQDAISIEPFASPDFEKETHGLDAIIAKGHKFESMVQETHGITTSDPLITDNVIAFTLNMDITMKERPRMNMRELCVYHVKDGKIVSEQFFM